MLVTADAGPATSVGHLWLTDFRCLHEIDIELASGLTVLQGANGQGKTSLLEAVGWVARARSFRGVADAMLVRSGATEAIVRAEVTTSGRQQLFEAEIRVAGRNRVLCNRQPVIRSRDLHGLLRVTVFAPDDLTLVKGGPSERREYLDELLAMLAARYDAARSDFERVLKQRNALLRSGVRDEDARFTLDVFDEQLVHAGAELTRGRLRLLERLVPTIANAYEMLAHDARPITAEYMTEASPVALTAAQADDVEELLREALARRRGAEIDRGLTLVGPHRDELQLMIDGLDARHQASQGEQRTLALALRLAGHMVVRELAGAAPVLLLDDV
ncbi:MAG: replication and repair protein RecF, partial [Actinomycetota bacterium]|nr:replication and repair protein RecF [Actinomycetota bacterium]